MPGQQAYKQQMRVVASAGAVVAVVLAAAFALMLGVDRQVRLSSMQRQASLQAQSTHQLLRQRLDSTQRAMTSVHNQMLQLQQVLGSTALQRPLLEQILEQTAGRNPEMVDWSVVDDSGQLLAGSRGDPDFYDWAIPANLMGDSALYIGPLQARSDNSWQLPLALRIDAGRWLLARLRGSQMQALVADDLLGAGGVQLLLDRAGLVLADSRGPRLLGRELGYWSQPRAQYPQALHGQQVFADEVVRIVAVMQTPQLPLTVVTARARDEALVGWWRYVAGALLIYLIYLIGVAYLLYAIRNAHLQQQRLAREIRAGSAELALANKIGRVSTWTANAQTLHWGHSAAQVFGLDRNSAPLSEVFERVHHLDVSMVRRSWQLAWAGEQPLDLMFRLVFPGGVIRWLSVRGERVADGSGYMTGAAVDVTERVQAQERAREAERQFRILFERNPVPFWLFDLDTLRFLEINQAAVERYGYSRDELLAMTVLDIRPPEDWAELRETISLIQRGVLRESRVRTHQRKDGSLLSVQEQTARLEFAGHDACLVLAVDVTERLAYERDLAYRASHHPETGLLTRRALADTLDMRDRPYAIAHVQLRGLQLVGDTLGQDIGEQVLRTVAARLGGLAGRYGLLAYQPGEDFILAIKGRYDLEHVLEHLAEVVSEPIRGPESFHQLQAHIGVDSCSDNCLPADTVMARAAQAAHAARADGVLIKYYDEAVAQRLTARLHMAARIHSAIEQGEFELYFQPICRASDTQPVMLEALLRWPQADGSSIMPGEFISLAEDTGQMIALGRWVIRAAARAQHALANAGWRDVSVAVNVSAVQFFNDDLVGEFSRACEDAGIPTQALQVELTESSLMRDPERGLQTMQRLHERGIKIALDDFGTGFSSMSYLQHLPLDALKIDRSFVADVETNPRNAAICRALLSLGHSLGLEVIAEGVETEGQRQWLQVHDCDQLQGYLLSRPMSLDDVLQWLATLTARG
ncbi:EAL domain-containing protein [Stenotrophomonas koreensis]|uniref:bifunctional diguanylate cyclase/phosphodiesterase n=1 Tax=Stenotrophomonas koreensis TaxID=266128 RepID=UPI003390E74B